MYYAKWPLLAPKSTHAVLLFKDVLWPDFGMQDFVECIFEYQRHHASVVAMQGAEGARRVVESARARGRAADGEGSDSDSGVSVGEDTDDSVDGWDSAYAGRVRVGDFLEGIASDRRRALKVV